MSRLRLVVLRNPTGTCGFFARAAICAAAIAGIV